MSSTSEDGSEREFLHALASPLASSLMVIELLSSSLQKGNSQEVCAQQLSLVQASLEKLKALLDQRRALLKSRVSLPK